MTLVCSNCGKATCSCSGQNPPAPDLDMIHELCAKLRKLWPQHRLDVQEGHEELDIPSVHRVTDHMRRHDKSEGSR